MIEKLATMGNRTTSRPAPRLLPGIAFLLMSMQLTVFLAAAEAQETCYRGIRHPGYKSRVLMNAVEDGHHQETWDLLRDGADLESENGRNLGITPLLTAVLHQRRDIVRMLLECGADVNHTNDQGYSPLIVASARNTGETISRLLDAGADTTARTDSGVSALDIAIRCVQPQNVRRLLSLKGAASFSADDVRQALASANELKQTAATATAGRSVTFHLSAEFIPASAEINFDSLCSAPARDVQGLDAIVEMLESGSK